MMKVDAGYRLRERVEIEVESGDKKCNAKYWKRRGFHFVRVFTAEWVVDSESDAADENRETTVLSSSPELHRRAMQDI